MGSRAKKESELDKCVDRAYRQLKERIYKTKYSGGVFECPFCVDKKGVDYTHDELVQHARRRGEGAKDMDLKHQGQHLALAEYLVKYHSPKAPSAPSNKGVVRGQSGRDMVSHHSSGKEMQVGSDSPKVPPLAPIDKGELHAQCGGGDAHCGEEVMQVRPENSSSTYLEQDKSKKFVVPWKGVLQNVPIVFKDGRYVGESGTKAKAQLAEQGIDAGKVTPLWSKRGHSGCCVVDFAGDWKGFGNAMKFEKAFEVDRRGKTDWNMARSRGPGDKLYGWVATKEDYHSSGLLGKHLRPLSDLKSIHDIEAEEKRKAAELVQNLTSNIENKKLECKMMTDKLEAMSDSARNVMDESDAMVEAHNKEMNKMHRKQREEMELVLAEHERTKKKIESQKKQLKLQEKELEKREVRNENELRELSRQQRTNEIANEVQIQVHANMLKLAEEQKNEKEALHKKIIVLEKELDHKQALELEVERMRGAMNVMKHMGDDEDGDDKKKMESIKEELEEKIEELDNMEALKQALIIKEHKASEEMQEALDTLIAGLQSGSSKGAKPTIGVKTVGELDGKPFEVAAKKKFPADVASERAAEWWSLYEAYVRDISWRPFKRVSEEGTDKEVIDEEDERLQELKNELGEEPYNAVVTALTELNEYSPEDRTPRTELWNFKTQEKSDLNEGAIFLLHKWKLARKRR